MVNKKDSKINSFFGGDESIYGIFIHYNALQEKHWMSLWAIFLDDSHLFLGLFSHRFAYTFQTFLFWSSGRTFLGQIGPVCQCHRAEGKKPRPPKYLVGKKESWGTIRA